MKTKLIISIAVILFIICVVALGINIENGTFGEVPHEFGLIGACMLAVMMFLAILTVLMLVGVIVYVIIGGMK